MLRIVIFLIYLSGFDINEREIIIDLGSVKNLLSSIEWSGSWDSWTYPWKLDITDKLVEKNNRLVIEVANLWINRLVGDEKLKQEGKKGYTFTTYNHYDATATGAIGSAGTCYY